MKRNADTIKGPIKTFLGRSIYGPRLHQLLLGNAAVIVTFHRVNNIAGGDGLTCSVEGFERYCRFFANYFNVLSLRDLIGKIESGAPLNGDLAITFDDGYRDNYQFAAPLLKTFGLPATFFVVSQFIGTEFVQWWDRNLSVPQTWMTWDEVRFLHCEGFEIGAHSRTHANLGEACEEKAREEIFGSRFELEDRLSTPVDLFAYPYGRENHISEENREIVKAAGFRCCCSCFGGVNGRGTDPFHLRRISISSWYESPPHFGFDVALRRA